jgi:RNA polymerase sigma factor (TIGR02999 family)
MDQKSLETSVGEMTQLLEELDRGGPGSEEAVFRRQYGKLRKIASRVLGACGGGLSMQTTEIVNEFYLRLKNQEQIAFTSTEHFLHFARKKMREVVWDYARTRNAQKRPPANARVSLDDVLTDLRHNGLATADSEPEMVLFLEQLLRKLEERSERDGEIVDLYYFVGLSQAEIAQRYGVTEDAIKKRVKFIRAWLNSQLKQDRNDRSGEVQEGGRVIREGD